MQTNFDSVTPIDPRQQTGRLTVPVRPLQAADERIGNLHPNRLLHSRQNRNPPELHYEDGCVSPVAVPRGRNEQPFFARLGSSFEIPGISNMPTPPSPLERPLHPSLTASQPMKKKPPESSLDPWDTHRMLPPSAQSYLQNEYSGYVPASPQDPVPAVRAARPDVRYNRHNDEDRSSAQSYLQNEYSGYVPASPQGPVPAVRAAWPDVRYNRHNDEDRSPHPLATRPLPIDRLPYPHDSQQGDHDDLSLALDRVYLLDEEDEEQIGRPYIPSTPAAPVPVRSSRNAVGDNRRRQASDDEVQRAAQQRWPVWNVPLHLLSVGAPPMLQRGERAPEVPPRNPMREPSGEVVIPADSTYLDSFFSEAMLDSDEYFLPSSGRYVPETPDAPVPVHQNEVRGRTGRENTQIPQRKPMRESSGAASIPVSSRPYVPETPDAPVPVRRNIGRGEGGFLPKSN